jgi:hypothetical protein
VAEGFFVRVEVGVAVGEGVGTASPAIALNSVDSGVGFSFEVGSGVAFSGGTGGGSIESSIIGIMAGVDSFFGSHTQAGISRVEKTSTCNIAEIKI